MVSAPQADNTKSVLDSLNGLDYQFGMKNESKIGKYPNHLREHRLAAGLTQGKLAKAAGTKQPTIVKFEKGQRELTFSWATRLAPALGIPPIHLITRSRDDAGIEQQHVADARISKKELDAGKAKSATGKNSSLTTEPRSGGSHETFPPNVRFGAPPIEPFARVPLRGQGMGGKDGAIVFHGGDNMGDILAPPILFNVPGAYAVYVVGDSMANRFKDGEVVYVHPHRRVGRGDDCVIQIEKDEGGERLGWIKEFVSRDDKTLKVRQHNPKKILTFPIKKVVSVHLIVMSGKV